MQHTLLDATALPFYEWLDVPAWVFDPQRMRTAWANASGCTYWRADNPAELLARDFGDASESARARLALTVQAHARGEVLRESWTLYPKGRPITSILVSRGLLLANGTQALLFVSERLPADIAPDTLRGVEALAHTTVRIALHGLPGGSTLMRNPSAAQAFGPLRAFSGLGLGLGKGLGKGLGEGQRDFESMFCEPGVAARIFAQLRRGQTFSAELELQTLQGVRWHAVDVRPVLDPVSGDKAMQFNARDIGDLKAVQKALELARITADNANQAKSTFLANMSHEIRTPMNGVLGLTELALQMELGEKQRKYIALAHQSAQGLMVIINDLLDVAKIEAGRMLLAHDPFSLSQCITDALSPLQLAASDKALELSWQVDDGVPDRLIGDAARLRQVLINLVGNALKFTHAGAVRVEVAKVPAEVPAEPSAAPLAEPGEARALTLRFSVHDTGIGLSADETARIFEPFAQADGSITRRYGGTGLGLTIVARLVKLMGADMQVTSTPGEGSCFSFAVALVPA